MNNMEDRLPTTKSDLRLQNDHFLIRDIQYEILVNLRPADCVRYQTVCKLWRKLLLSQSLWKRKCNQYWPYYTLNNVENYYRLFLQRGGGHFVTSAKQFFALKKMAKKNGWIERVPRLSPTGSFTCSSAWRIRNTASGLNIVYSILTIYGDGGELGNASKTSELYNATSAAHLKHQHLSPPIHIFPKNQADICIIIESEVECPLDDLLGDNRTGDLTEKKIIKIVKQILSAIKFLHQNHLIASQEGGVYPICEIKDDWFHIKLFNYTLHTATLDTYMDVQILMPELFGQPDTPLTTAADMWAIGELTHMMLFGETLNGHAHPMRRILMLQKEGAVIADPNNEVSDAAKDFLLKLFSMDPLKRMTAAEAMNHAWITDPNPTNVVLKTSWKVWRSRYKYNQGKYPPSPDKN